MKTIIKKLMGEYLRKRQIVVLLLLLFCSSQTEAQNASEWNNANTQLSTIAGVDCSAFGYGALDNNGTGGRFNSALGKDAMLNNVNGDQNTAMGMEALYSGDDFDNTAVGRQALYNNSGASRNTAVGEEALWTNSTGEDNTAFGFQALYVMGIRDENTALGSLADGDPAEVNQTVIGYGALPSGGSDIVSMGNGAVTSITGYAPYSWSSDRRIKDNIKESTTKGLEFIKRLRPLVYNFDARKLTEYKVAKLPPERRKLYLDIDFSEALGMRRSGFLAQEVEEAANACGFEFSGLKKPGDKNGIYSLSYNQFVMPLVKAVQEQQVMIESLQQEIDTQQNLLRDASFSGSNETGTAKLIGNETGFSMEANRPNPFSSETIINFNLPAGIDLATLIVSGLNGKEIFSLPILERGNASITLSAEKLNPGIYIYSMTGNGKILGSKRMVVSGK